MNQKNTFPYLAAGTPAEGELKGLITSNFINRNDFKNKIWIK